MSFKLSPPAHHTFAIVVFWYEHSLPYLQFSLFGLLQGLETIGDLSVGCRRYGVEQSDKVAFVYVADVADLDFTTRLRLRKPQRRTFADWLKLFGVDLGVMLWSGHPVEGCGRVVRGRRKMVIAEETEEQVNERSGQRFSQLSYAHEYGQ